MVNDSKKEMIERYIITISDELNQKYENIIPEKSISKIIEKFTNMPDSFEDIKIKIDKLVSEKIEKYNNIQQQREIILQQQRKIYNLSDEVLNYKNYNIQSINIENLSFEQLNELYYHYSLKTYQRSIDTSGLIPTIGRNSENVDEKPAIYFSYSIEGVLETWDVWLKWRLNRLNNPQWQPENQKLISEIKNGTASEEEKKDYYFKYVNWTEEFLSKDYKKNQDKLKFLFEFIFDEMISCNYYSLDLHEGEEFTFDEIDIKKQGNLAKKDTEEDLAYRYNMEMYGSYSDNINTKVDKWNMNTILGKELVIEPDRIFQLSLKDGKNDVLSIVSYLYKQYKINIPISEQVNFDLLDTYMEYCDKKQLQADIKKQAESMVEAMANGQLDTNGQPIIQNQEITSNNRKMGFAKIWVLGILTIIVSIGIIVIGVLLNK